MPTDQHSNSGRRPHYGRGRRGPDRRGDRRPPPTAPGEPAKTDGGVDVDQIVRDIKARIAQKHGIELTSGQIQELAARRLEAILDPRTIKPSLLEQLRRSAGAPAEIAPVEPPAAYEFEDHTLFDTHNGLLRMVRGWLRPVLKLFFNPNPLVQALNAQAKINKDAARREEAREREQAEWNALHYTLVQRLVTELTRTSIDTQNLTMRVEALSARVDYYERRVRGLESGAQLTTPPAASAIVARPLGVEPQAPGAGDPLGDGPRKRRRRRRGRRGPGAPDGSGPQPGFDGGEGGEDDDSEPTESASGVAPPSQDRDTMASQPAEPAARPAPEDRGNWGSNTQAEAPRADDASTGSTEGS